MKKRFIKSIAVLFAAVLLFSALPFTASAASAETEQNAETKSGTTGDCTWKLDANGKLTISGNGRMADYSSEWDEPEGYFDD